MKCLIFISLIMLLFACKKEDNSTPSTPSENITVTINSHTANQIINNNAEISLVARPSSTVKKIEYYIDGQSIGSTISDPYSFKWTPKDLDGGTHKIAAVATSALNNEFKAETSFQIKLRLGDDFKGGKIYYIDATGQKGLIPSTADAEGGIANSFTWGKAVLLGTTDDGVEDTKKMAASSDNEYQAGFKFKNGFERNGYKDWYIPSGLELNLLKENQLYVGNFPTVTKDAFYW